MAVETGDFDTLMRDWNMLAAGDRKAILSRLPIDRRLEFQRLIASAQAEMRGTVARESRFRDYSSWLARLIEACEEEAPEAAHLSPATRSALQAGHEQAALTSKSEPAGAFLPELAQTAIRCVKAWL